MFVKCRICDKEMLNNLGLSSHLRSKHKITVKKYYDLYLKKEGEGTCIVCGNETGFINISKGYHKNCSIRCGNITGTEKTKQNNLKKYGVVSTLQLEEVKQKSFLKKEQLYGDKNYNNPKKARQTNMERYGVENTFDLPGAREKGKKILEDRRKEKLEKKKQEEIEKYGKLGYTKAEKISITKHKKLKSFEEENNCISANTLKTIYGQGWYKSQIVNYLYNEDGYAFVLNENIQIIKKYVEQHELSTSSLKEKEMLDFIKSVYNGEIIENSRKIIPPYEIDIYIPELKIALEFNGVYHHSINVGTSKNYHLIKTDRCVKNGIRLIHIFEYEWDLKKEICKSIISSALGIYNKRIYARQCEIKEVSSKEAKLFLEENHLQGNTPSSYRLGLYHQNELVQLITIGKSRFKKDEYELLRMCSKLNTQVIGGFSRLMKYQPYDEIFSYIDRSKYSGGSYFIIGFNLLYGTPPSYCYFKNGVHLNRVSAQKYKLKKLLGDGYDSTISEKENMLRNRYLMIYDCGNYKVVYNKLEGLYEEKN